MTQGFWDIMIGLVLGLLTSFVSWAILFHYLVPKIGFSCSLAKVRRRKTQNDKAPYRYKFKIENSGRRNIIDIELTARLSVKGLKSPTKWNRLYIPLESGTASHRIPQLLPATKGKSGRRPEIFLTPNSSDWLREWTVFPEEIPRKAADKSLLVEDLLKLGKEAKLEIQAYCYDSFSGSRKLYVSPPYTADAILAGEFDPTSLEVIPAAPNSALHEAEPNSR